MECDSQEGGSEGSVGWTGEEYEEDSVRGVQPSYLKFSKRLLQRPEQCVRCAWEVCVRACMRVHVFVCRARHQLVGHRRACTGHPLGVHGVHGRRCCRRPCQRAQVLALIMPQL